MPDSAPVDVLVRHAYVITMDDDHRLISDGAIAIADGKIVAVGDDGEVAGRYRASKVIDAQGAPCHPGLIEAHAHTTYQMFRSAMADHMVEHEVFDKIEQPFYNAVSIEDEFLSTVLAGLEMVSNGTTCFLEAGTALAPSAVSNAAKRVGIRAVVGDSFIWDSPHGFAMGEDVASRSKPLVPGAPNNFEEAVERLGLALAKNTDPRGLVRGHIAVLGLGTASERLLIRAKELADAHGVVLNLHQSYSPADTAADRRRFGADPLVHLERLGVLDKNVTLAHANYLTDAECESLITTGATLAWAPSASLMWGHGGTRASRHGELWRRGVNIALGSDSPNWSNDFDLFNQAALAVLTTRDMHARRDYLIAEDGLYMATRGGARAVGLQKEIGSIEIGKLADIVIHSATRPELHPRTDVVRNLLYSSRSKGVDTVIIDGVVVLENGKFPHLNLGELIAEFDARSEALFARMGVNVEANSVDQYDRLYRLSERD